MTKILNFGLKIKGLVERVAHAKSSDPATPPPNVKRALGVCVFGVGPMFLTFSRVCRGWFFGNNRLILLQTEGN